MVQVSRIDRIALSIIGVAIFATLAIMPPVAEGGLSELALVWVAAVTAGLCLFIAVLPNADTEVLDR